MVHLGKREVITLKKKFHGCHHDLVDRYGICVTNDHGYVPLIVSTSRSFPYSRLITGTVYHCGAPELTPGFSGVLRCSIFSFMCMFYILLFVLLYFFLLAIVLSVLLRYTDYYYPFGIFKLVLLF
jgi:hypothetical protein